MKVCTKCGELKPLDSFYKRVKGSVDGHRNECKTCLSTKHKAHYQLNRDKIIQKSNAYYHADLVRQKNMRLKRDFGISIEDYTEMLNNQSGKCAICGTTECKSGRHLAVDHNHQTGEIRGLLCGKCNQAIGLLDDSITNLLNAVDYLKAKGSYGGTDDIHSAAA